MPIEYRVAKPSDLKQILPLVEGFAMASAWQLGTNMLAENFMEFAGSGLAQTIEHPFGCVMVAEQVEDGVKPRLVGYCAASAQEPPGIFEPVPYVFMTDLYVLPEFRRQGIARGLVERVKGWGLLKGITRVSLVLPVGSEANGLYNKMGFRPVQQLLFYEEKE